MRIIEQFAEFIKQNRLNEAVKQQMELYHSNQILLPLPLDKKQTFDYFKERLAELLTAIQNGKELEHIQNRLLLFKNNNLFVLSTQISLFDVIKAWSLQKIILMRFVPQFTTDINAAITISTEMDQFYMQAQVFILNTFESIQKTANTQLLESEERYKDLFDNAHDLIHMAQPDGHILYVNSAWMNCLDYPMEEITGKPIYSFVDETDLERFTNYRKSILAQTLKDKEITITLKTKNGNKITAEGFVSAKFKNGVPLYTRGIFRDISHRIENEKKLKFYNEQLIEREENLQQLVTHAPDAIIVIDVDGKILLWNPKAEEIFGWKEEEIAGKTLEETIIPPGYRQAHTEGMKRYLSTGKAHILNRTIEITALNRQGQEFFISLTISKSQRSSKTIFISFIRDITQQKINEKELERKRKELENSNRELEQYAWLTSHDLKEPLRKIVTYSDIILTRNKEVLPDEIKKSVVKIYEAGKRMGNLIEAILQYSSITDERSLFEEVDLNQVLQEVLVDLELQIKEKNAEIETGFLPTLDAVPFQMRQLLQNLISNALKYNRTNKKPEIKILSENTDVNSVTLYVIDKGMGFEMKDEKKIFQLFQRLTNQQQASGTGVGLALCKKIVQNHEGTITVDSKINEGTTFIIQLPVKHSFS